MASCVAIVTLAGDRHRGAGANNPPSPSKSPKPPPCSKPRPSPSAWKCDCDEPGEGGIVPPIERPLLLFGDDPRNHTRGILWGWGRAGPSPWPSCGAARAENAPFAVFAHAHRLEMIVATPTESPSGGRPKSRSHSPLCRVPPPADAKEPGRLRQIKEIARRFTAHEFWDPDNSRFELRLLVQPVHRYRDAAD